MIVHILICIFYLYLPFFSFPVVCTLFHYKGDVTNKIMNFSLYLHDMHCTCMCEPFILIKVSTRVVHYNNLSVCIF